LRFVNGTSRLTLGAGSGVIVEAGGNVAVWNINAANNIIIVDGSTIWNGQNNAISGTSVIGTPIYLPIELLQFDAISKLQRVELHWSTASEINNDYFMVERCRDGENWISVGAIKGDGNSSSRKEYQLTDYAPLNGEQWYRLVQVDYDGNFEIFEPVLINFSSGNKISVYPNPAVEEVQVILHDIVGKVIFLTDVYGRVVYTSTISDIQQFRLPLHDYLPGFYMVNIQGDGFNYSTRLVIK
jgi:hypothetical protein